MPARALKAIAPPPDADNFWYHIRRDDLRCALRRHTGVALADMRVRGGVWESCVEGNWIAVRALLKPEGRYGRIAA